MKQVHEVRIYESDRGRGRSSDVGFDYILLIIVLTISALGLIFLNSAQYDKYADHGVRAMIIQVAGIVIGVALALLLNFVDYGYLRNLSFPFYIINVALMLAVFIPGLGSSSGGSRSWIDLKFVTYQPAELMKPAFIIVAAKYIERIREEEITTEDFVVLLISFLITLALMFLQMDLGMVMTLCVIFIVMLFVGKIKFKFRHIAVLAGVALVGVAFVWKFYLNSTRRARIMAFFQPEKYPEYSLQQTRSITAIGSGKLFGQGIGEGSMNTSNKILVKLSDMIFSVIGEEGGFLWCLIFVGLFAALLIKMISISSKARDIFGQCIAAGIFAMFAAYIFENLGMNVGILPITGLPLPFVSQGGSAMVTNFISIGLLLSISKRRKKGVFV